MVFYSTWKRWLAKTLAISLITGTVITGSGPEAHAAESLTAPGDIVHEAFDGTATGSKPGGAGWSYKEALGTVSVAETPDAANKSLKIERTGTDTATNLYARSVLGTALTGQYVVRAKVMAAQTDATIIAMQLRSSDSKELATVVFTTDGNIRYQLASGTVIMQPYASGVWYDIAAVVDTGARQYSLFIDGVKKAGPIDFKNTDASNLKQTDFQVFRTTTGAAYFDDIDVYTHSLVLNKTAATLALGDSEQLSATVQPSWTSLQAVTWSSSDNGVVRVDGQGRMTAWGAGTAVITAAAEGGAYAECTVTVPAGPEVPVTGLALSRHELTMYTGDSLNVSAELEPFYATNKKIHWQSAQPSVVSVVYDVYAGTATLNALTAGVGTITAVSEDGAYSDSMQVTVKPGGDLVNERFETYAPGTKPGTFSIPSAAGVTAEVADNPYSSGRSFRIEKPAPTANSYNVSKALSAGHAKLKLSIRAMAKQTDAVVYVANVRNSAGAAVAQTIFHNNGKIAVMQNGVWEAVQPYETNRWYQFDLALNAATGKYDLYIDGALKRTGLALMTSADEFRNLQFGMYSQAAGTAYFDDIQAFSYRPVTGFGLSGVPAELGLHRTTELKPDFVPADPTFTSVLWTSSDPAVLAVDELGHASGLSEGYATITGTTVDGSWTASVQVRVLVRHPASVSLSATELALPIGSDRLLTAAVLPADSSNPAVAWTTSNPSVATVDSEGRVTAVGAGSAQITATTADGGHAASAVVTAAARQLQAAYYVSPSGNDGNPGTEAAPFQTLQKARDAVRTVNADMTGDIVVYMREGSYVQQATLLFDERDSGSNGHWVIYKAYPGEKPVIEGGKRITGWTLHDAGQNIYKASAGGDIETRQLYVNGIRAVRARSEGGLTAPVKTEGGYISDDTAMTGWGRITDLEFVYKAEWTNPRIGVQAAAVENGKAVFTMKQPGWGYVTIRPSVVNPWYVENAYELLDEPGEWYLDRSTDTFYYKPRPGESLNTAEVVAPVIEELMKLEGTTLDTPVDGIHFEGLTFSYTTWLRPSSDMGHADAQNNLLRYGIDKLPIGAVTVEKASHIRFERNEFSKLGIMAIKMVNGVQESLIRGNRFFDISGGAINVGETTKLDTDISNPSDPRKLLKNVDITNNYIHDIGIDYRSSAAIGLGFVVDADVSHNEIFNVPYDGITIGYGLAHVKTSALRNAKLHANFIHDILGEQIYDGGAIYTLGGTGGTAGHKNEITENYLCNQMNRYGVIYNDEGSTYWKSERNVIDTTETPMWDEIFPATWGFVNGSLTSHDILFDTNYTTTSAIKTVGASVYEVNTQVYPDADWPAEALAIIARSGLEAAYKDLAAGIPERIVLPKKLELASSNGSQLTVAATTGKDEPVTLAGASITYASEDETVAEVNASGYVTATGPGATRIRVQVKLGEMLWTRHVPVYVDDEYDRIEVYYVQNKAKQFLGEEYALLRGGEQRLIAEAKSLYGQTMNVTAFGYTSSNPSVVQIDAQGLLTAAAVGSADVEFSLMVDGIERTRTIEVNVLHFGNPAGLEYDAYSLDEVINDPDRWHVYASGSGNLQAETDSLTIVTPSGFATYQGDTFEDELLTMDLQLDSDGGWPSLALRIQQPNQPFTSATNDLYLICFKEDVIELHRFNGGERTVIYGNISGYTSIGGPGIPNYFIPFHELHRVQVGAVNESGGVRLILNIDGENVFYFLDTAAGRIDDPGYFGLYARSGSMTLKTPQE
ncbi:Ig-like domain (group 2) [Paenibacillus sp. UNCCL117]|uniref:Ig-like domain-containing protein n=1 Tax=unclassified Paenibacillus TaxID=185978 RepID=UPI0008826ABD|nr:MULTISPECIES: Ig-like domain-containing protein [unclassified Paenibacillus]SDD48066.1 Ig-like domain (group 2) [Paenibacillus sp. cl123]SFW50322.1 Ig-like domain (group 2) [Paenibacillus sp. UNCCL117]